MGQGVGSGGKGEGWTFEKKGQSPTLDRFNNKFDNFVKESMTTKLLHLVVLTIIWLLLAFRQLRKLSTAIKLLNLIVLICWLLLARNYLHFHVAILKP